jgi:hypothetical protein
MFCILLGAAIALAAGCEYEAALAAEEVKQIAADKKLAVMGMPCTWVAQCGHPISDCPIQNRQCVNADMRPQ